MFCIGQHESKFAVWILHNKFISCSVKECNSFGFHSLYGIVSLKDFSENVSRHTLDFLLIQLEDINRSENIQKEQEKEK